MQAKQNKHGFTIVELLIVIVIIGILAVITIVAYNGIQLRANSASIISSANSSFKMLSSYIATNGKYPDTNYACVTLVSGCSLAGSNATFNTSMATAGSLPASVPVTGSNRYGIQYLYDSTRTFNGTPQPAVLLYWLSSVNQQCGVAGVANGAFGALAPSTTGYTDGNDATTGKTLCVITIPGPNV